MQARQSEMCCVRDVPGISEASRHLPKPEHDPRDYLLHPSPAAQGINYRSLPAPAPHLCGHAIHVAVP